MYVTEEIGDEHKFYLIKTEAVFTDSRGDSNKASRQFSSNKTASINTVAVLFDFVKERTADFERDSDNPILFQPKTASEIVNADGTPKIMYHGTPNQFTEFDKKKARSSGYYGRGFYFTDSIQTCRKQTLTESRHWRRTNLIKPIIILIPKYPHGWLDNYGKNNWDYWTVFIQEKTTPFGKQHLTLQTPQTEKKSYMILTQ